MTRLKAITLCVVFAVTGFATQSADSAAVAEDYFNPKINAWAEGSVMSLNADNGTFSIRGTKCQYASEYAKMLQEIHTKTAKLTGEERANKEAQIRANWATTLEKARTASTDKDSDFTFHLPTKDARLSFFDESAHYNRTMKDHKEAPSKPTTLSEAEHAAMIQLHDLKVGQFLVVGYDSGVISNDAFVVINGNKSLTQAAPQQHGPATASVK